MGQVQIQEIQDDSLLLKLNFVLEHVTRVSLKPTNRRDHVTVKQDLLFFYILLSTRQSHSDYLTATSIGHLIQNCSPLLHCGP